MPERLDVRRVPPRPAGGPRPVAARRPNPALRTVQVLLVVVSMVVFGGTWYSWSQLAKLNGLQTANVIDPGKATSPLEEQNILMVGLDTRTDAQGNPLPQDVLNQLHAGGADDGGDTTDTMLVIHIPAGGGAASAISIPRDSYVQLANGYGKHKINSAYSRAKNDAYATLSKQGVTGADRETKAAEAAAKESIQTVEQFTGLSITHYAAVNLAGFYYISQAVGGVPVCLVAPVKDSFSGADFPAGPQTVQGAAALEFVRQRHGLPNGDLDRIRRQQAFMSSMAKTVLSAGTLANPGKLNDLIAAVKKAVVIDQGWDVLQFAGQLQGMSAGNIKFQTIPIVSITLQTPEDGDAVQVNPQQVQQFVQQTFGATGTSTSSTGAAKPNTADYSSTTVDVRNASGVGGLAATVLDKAVAKGFGRGTTGNASARKTSTVNYPPGAKAAAQAVADALGGLPLFSDDTIPTGHVWVMVGSDYSNTYGFTGGAQLQLNTYAAAAPTTTSSTNGAITADGVPCIN